MTSFQAIILGLLQGLTEFLPVSSSGHLILVPHFLGWQDQGLAFDAMIHLGTALATIYHYRHDCHGVLQSFVRKNPDEDTRRLRNGILLASIPAIVVGVLAKDYIDQHARNVTLVAFNLIVWGVMLLIADRVASQRGNGPYQTTTTKQAIIGGIAQAFALLPGTSRSGATISATLLAGMNRPSAVRFSFLLGLPVILGVSGLSAIKLFTDAQNGEIFMMPLVLGLAASFVGGLLAIRIMLRFVSHHGLAFFAAYRFALAAAVLFFLR